MIGTCTLGRIVNMIKESQMNRISMPWAVVRMFSLLSQWSNIDEDPGVAGDSPAGQGAIVLTLSESLEVDELVYIKESVRLGPFQTQILGV